MEIIAQAVVGLSNFLHPDYMSAVGWGNGIDFSDGILSRYEFFIMLYSLVGVIILVILIANYISILRNRY